MQSRPQSSSWKGFSGQNNNARASTRVRASPKTRQPVGFKWDAGMQRWMKANNAELAVDPDATLIKPKTGSAYQAWPVVWSTLDAAGVKSVTPTEALKLVGKGWTLVDVRLADDHAKQHAEGAISLPLYRPVAGTSPWDTLKRVVMTVAFAMQATERNPNFQKDALQVLKKNQKVLVMCSIGGTLDTIVSYRREKRLYADPDRAFGRESRSLKAAYELLQAGWSPSNILHVDGGLNQWRYQGLPLDSN